MGTFITLGIFQIILVILAIIIAIAPLYIWKWTKSNNAELKKINKNLEETSKTLAYLAVMVARIAPLEKQQEKDRDKDWDFS